MSTGEQSSPGPSKRKELLAALVDGLDILVGMEERKEKEKREEEAPRTPDTFSGLLQSFIPLMIIPQLLPLFQQALGQTLSSTTVTVKVESATSIIPIDISASTAIVPIEIRASQVTLNVNIASQTTTLNVTITGNANVVITGQNVGVALSGTFSNLFGRDYTLVGEILPDVPAGAQNRTVINANNTTGETVMIEGFTVMGRPSFDTYVFIGKLVAELIVDGVRLGSVTITGEKMSETFTLLRAIRVPNGSNIQVVVSNFGTTPIAVRCTVYGYY
jgi:hypothetical protein